MKKVLILLMCVLGFVACKKSKTLIVEDAINADKKEMVQNATWYESTVVLNNYLDEECDGTVEEITNVFQVADSVINSSYHCNWISIKI